LENHTEFAQELDRIRDVYAQRKTLPSFRYDESNPAVRNISHEHRLATLRLLRRWMSLPLPEALILDVGCGTGSWIRQILDWGASPEHVFGIDLLPERIAQARQLTDNRVLFECSSAHELHFEDGQFDLLIQSTVFTSVLDPRLKSEIAREMLRVVRPGGIMLWYDFFLNNPFNKNVRGVGRREIETLFPNCRIALERITLAPPIARTISPGFSSIYRLLAALKIFCTHYLGVVKPM
jgi:ubiquinone/menaquinone biosynthesis C-methylase UbiE